MHVPLALSDLGVEAPVDEQAELVLVQPGGPVVERGLEIRAVAGRRWCGGRCGGGRIVATRFPEQLDLSEVGAPGLGVALVEPGLKSGPPGREIELETVTAAAPFATGFSCLDPGDGDP